MAGHVPRPWSGNHEHREGCVAGATDSGGRQGMQKACSQG